MKKENLKINAKVVNNKEIKKSLTETFGATQINFVRIIKNNTEIRRYTSLAVINYLKQKGKIEGDKNYVTYAWDKFRVISNGLAVEYRYTEEFLIKSLIGSFNAFANNATNLITDFLNENNIDIENINNEVSENK